MNPPPFRRIAPAWTFFSVLLVVLLAGSAAAQENDADLDQLVGAEEPIATDVAVLDAGHVDIGPRFVDGRWTLMIRDDTTAESTWRRLDDTVLRLGDVASEPVPEDPAYSFVGAEPGESVWVVPQTQDPEVVWVGWNTQDPEVMERIDRGATLTLQAVQGPGRMTMYLQSGNFGAPEVLWDSAGDEAQSVFVDVNTHTHANWVFTEPGVYLVRVGVTADLVSGETVRDTQELRFAVGDATDATTALTARSTVADLPDPSDEAARSDERSDVTDDPGSGTDSTIPVVGLLLAATLLGAVVVAGIVRTRRTKDRAAQLAGGGDDARSRTGDRA